MPIFHAKRLIRCAAEAVAESEAYDQDRVERGMRDADRAAEAGAKQDLCARTLSATRWLSDSSTPSTSQRRTSSRAYLPRRRQLRCCGCSRRSWTALPESLCWLACTSNFFFSHHHLRFLTQHTVFKVDSRSTPHAAHAEMCYLWEG